jgi:hypothetical protein
VRRCQYQSAIANSKSARGTSARRVIGPEVKFPAPPALKDIEVPRLADQPNRHRETHRCLALVALRRCGALWQLVGHRRPLGWREHVVSLCHRPPETPGRWWITTLPNCGCSANECGASPCRSGDGSDHDLGTASDHHPPGLRNPNLRPGLCRRGPTRDRIRPLDERARLTVALAARGL